ncbi:hypothetical protein CPC08DRAFT_645079 [Agrocybe pediades]|nr:hypothetical protein CPC08DRAFT_645079 [Agrocybe pediades]
MNIESLLNPVGEAKEKDANEEDICEAVLMAKVARENIEINGGDDVDEDIPPEPLPTYKDLLSAVSVIRRYVEESNEPIARRLDKTLAPFCMHLRNTHIKSQKATVLTDYFRLKYFLFYF